MSAFCVNRTITLWTNENAKDINDETGIATEITIPENLKKWSLKF